MPLLDGLTPDLFRAGVWLFLFGLWMTSRDLPLRYAFFITALKVLIPLAYFSRNAAGVFHVSDDLAYYFESLRLLQSGYGIVSLFTDPLGIPMLMRLTGGFHVLYHLWNLASLSLLGPHYFSPVFFNVGATFAGGFFFVRILRSLDFPETYARAALAFFLLHWDVLAWSSFLNLKDTLVMTLTLALLHQGILAFKRPGLLRLFWILALLTLCVFLRFYVPILILTALLLHVFLGGGSKRNALLGAALGTIVCAALVFRAFPGLAGNLGRVHPEAILFGAPRFVLTPLPWKLSPEYRFLLLPSLLHLLCILPAALALPALWKRAPHARLPFLYFFLIVIFYSIVPDLQGPRQRLQAGFIFVWLQFHALWVFARYAAGPEKLPEPEASTGPQFQRQR